MISQVAYGGERVIIERRGKPVAAIVSISDLKTIEDQSPTLPKPQGLLAAAGAWGVLTNEQIDEFVAHVYATRAADKGRPVDLGH